MKKNEQHPQSSLNDSSLESYERITVASARMEADGWFGDIAAQACGRGIMGCLLGFDPVSVRLEVNGDQVTTYVREPQSRVPAYRHLLNLSAAAVQTGYGREKRNWSRLFNSEPLKTYLEAEPGIDPNSWLLGAAGILAPFESLIEDLGYELESEMIIDDLWSYWFGWTDEWTLEEWSAFHATVRRVLPDAWTRFPWVMPCLLLAVTRMSKVRR